MEQHEEEQILSLLINTATEEREANQYYY